MRRTSLPALPAQKHMSYRWHNSNYCGVDTSIILEAHGIVTDMLLEHSVLPSHIVAGLQALAALLTPPPPSIHHYRSKIPAQQQSEPESEDDEAPFPDSGEKVSKKNSNSGKKSFQGNLLRRMSTSTWTTTTSATGMPTLEPQPNNRRRKSTSITFRSGTLIGDERTNCGDEVEVDDLSYASNLEREISENVQSQETQTSKNIFSSPTRSINTELQQLNISGHDEVPNENVIVAKDGLKFDLAQVISDPYLVRLEEWDFPIFELNDAAPYQIITNMCYKIFHEVGLFETFKIPVQEFINYFHALELGYRDKPYHNRMHAADVLHGVYYLTSRPIPGFHMLHTDSESTPNSTNKGDGFRDWTSFVEEEYGIMAGNFPPLELMAMYTAAGMHDYDHPGRTNAFLVTTHTSQAILYNDRSVLENHHAASAWALLLGNKDCNFLKNLDGAEFKVNESMAVGGLNWHSETDRLLISEIVVKLADINGPCKMFDIHFQWTKRIASEFYEQGDEEQKLGLPISPYMDRQNPQLARLQESFINHLVGPLTKACAIAGLLPGYWVDRDDPEILNCEFGHPELPSSSEESSEDDMDQVSSNSNSCGGNGTGKKKPKKEKKKSIFCIMTKHLQDNHNHWAAIIKQEEARDQMGSCSNLSLSNEDMMEIIEEENTSTPRSLNRSFSFEREDSKL